jgi:competence protein ComEC
MLGGEIATTVTGRVAAMDHLANGRVRLTVDVQSTERPKLRYAPDRIRASARKIPGGLGIGDTVTGLVRLQPPSGPVRPDSYDFSFESYFDGIGANGFFMRDPVPVADAGAASVRQSISASIENARLRVAARVRDRIDGPEGEIAAALMVGVRAGIPEQVNEALRRSGLYHIISISGLHMALVAACVMGGLRAGFALFPGFASRRPVKKYAAAAAIVALGAYLFVSGGEVAAQRSFIMLAVMLVALIFDRAALTMRNLAISALVVIAIAPHEVVGPSFQMSFAATAALVGAYAFWSERRAQRDAPAFVAGRSATSIAVRRVGAIVIGLALTSIVAGLATAAFGAYHFQRVSPLSLAANLAVMPVVSLLVVPFAVLAAIAMPFGLDGPFLDVMGFGLSMMIKTAEWFSQRSPIDAVGLVSTDSVVLITAALVLACMPTTWVRLTAVPFAVAGLVTLGDIRAPDVLVSEDGRLVGVASDGNLAVDRPRPNAFTLDNWTRALKAGAVVKPGTGDAPTDAGFACDGARCMATHPSGAVIVHTASLDEARAACAFASVIVLDDAAARLRCGNPMVAVIDRRELARSGSAAIHLPATPGAGKPQVEFAIAPGDRPWHDHRRFSREARGLAPYAKKPNVPLPSKTDAIRTP